MISTLFLSPAGTQNAYIILHLPILALQQLCKVGWAGKEWLAQSHPVAERGLEPVSPRSYTMLEIWAGYL